MFGLINEKNVKKFTDLLFDLIINRKMNLPSALKVIQQAEGSYKKRKTALQRTGQYLLEILDFGCDFSYGLVICPFIRFPKAYANLIGFAEKSGNLESCLSYLKEKYERNQRNREQLAEASVYPLFVIVLAVILVFLLFVFGEKILGSEVITEGVRENLFSGSLSAFGILVIFCFFAIWMIQRLFRNNNLYEAFLAAGFLTKSGMCMADAVGFAAEILGPETKEGLLFEEAREKLSWGISLKDSFVRKDDGSDKRLNSQMNKAFCYVEFSGGNEAFEKVAAWIDSRDSVFRKYFFKLIEPAFILGTGVFLMVFLLNLVMPFLNGNLPGF
ncbi:MAG: type II secretion system F family protein [Treponema sp.]|nr:type II secretion system F family protein [Treponema sp.]